MLTAQRNLRKTIKDFLVEMPGQSVKELSIKLKVNRTFLSGYLKAMEDEGDVESRKVGPARVYYATKKQ